MVITAKTGLFLWLLAITLTTALTVVCVQTRLHPAPPAPAAAPEPCRDSAVIWTRGSPVYECDPRARLEVFPVAGSNSDILVKCTCARKDVL